MWKSLRSRPTALLLACLLVLSSSGVLGGSPAPVFAAGRGTVAGWVSFGLAKVTSATVLINCKTGCNDAQTSVDTAASLGCTAYAAFAGPTILSGNCFVFKNIPKNQQITVHVGYADGHQDTLKGYFFGWEPLLWIGVAHYAGQSTQQQGGSKPAAPSNLQAYAAAPNDVQPYAIYLRWRDNSHGQAAFRIQYCNRKFWPCTSKSMQTVVAGVTSWKFNFLAPEVTYCFWVQAYNDAGYSTSSNMACASTNKAKVPGPPSQPLLYIADASHGWNGWQAPPIGLADQGWSIANGMLESNGTASVIMAPFEPGQHGIADYAVETQIRVISGSNLWIHMRRGAQGYTGYDFDIRNGAAWICVPDSSQCLAQVPFDPGTSWHIYRAEVKGSHLRFLIDGAVIATATDSSTLSGGWIGLGEDGAQVVVRSYKVIAL